MQRGPLVYDMVNSAGASIIPVATTATVYTAVLDAGSVEYAALSYKATSTGTVSIALNIEQSFQRPATEGASDTTYVVPDGVSAITTITGTAWGHIAINPLALRYTRFRLVGGGSNAVDSTVRLKLSTLRNVR